MMGKIIYVIWLWQLFCPVLFFFQIVLVHLINKILASLCTLRIETRALWDIPMTQAGSEWWSDKLGYLNVSVPCFSNNCRQSPVIQITFCYKLVLFARHTLELCPCPVPLYFFSFLSRSIFLCHLLQPIIDIGCVVVCIPARVLTCCCSRTKGVIN